MIKLMLKTVVVERWNQTQAQTSERFQPVNVSTRTMRGSIAHRRNRNRSLGSHGRRNAKPIDYQMSFRSVASDQPLFEINELYASTGHMSISPEDFSDDSSTASDRSFCCERTLRQTRSNPELSTFTEVHDLAMTKSTARPTIFCTIAIVGTKVDRWQSPTVKDAKNARPPQRRSRPKSALETDDDTP